jgi:transcriptional regulator with XRE-family HTH domain
MTEKWTTQIPRYITLTIAARRLTIEFLEASDMRIQDLAKMLGCSRAWVSRVLNARTHMGAEFDLVQRLADALAVPVESISRVPRSVRPFGAALRRYRRQGGVLAKEAARAARLTPAQYWRLEHGTLSPKHVDRALVGRMVRALGLTPDDRAKLLKLI